MVYFLVALICGTLSTMAGSVKFPKSFRRFGIPLILIISSWSVIGAWAFLYALLILPLSMGYGRFDPTDDKPSTIGLWVHEHFGLGVDNNASSDWEDCIIRAIIGLVYGMVMLPVAFVSGNWLFYTIFCCVFSLFSVNYESLGKNIPDAKIFGTTYLSEEFIRGFIFGGLALAVGIL
jgi:hypothetical protein